MLRVLKMQKRAIRVLVKARFRDSCRDHFKKLRILTSVSVYILEIIKYVRPNLNKYTIRGAKYIVSEVCETNVCWKRYHTDLIYQQNYPNLWDKNYITSFPRDSNK